MNRKSNPLTIKDKLIKNFFVKFFSVLFVLFSFSSFINAQSAISKTVRRGLDYGYNFNWDKAEKVFQGLISKYPKDPRGYHYEASIYLWRYLSNQDKQNYNLFVQYSDTAIEKAKSVLEKNPENIELLYILGSDYSYRTLAFTKAEKFLDAVWASKKSDSYLSQTLSLDSTFYDAYLGLGLYYFGVGQIPSAFRWALSLAGIHGNKELGLKYIKLAAKEGNFSKVEAEYYLSQILSEFEFDYNSSSHYLQSLVSRYPDNMLFNYSLAVLDIKRKKLNEAENILEKIVTKEDSDFKQIISFSNFLMGDVYFKKNQFAHAKKYYLNFVSDPKDDDYKGIAYYRLAICYEITGDREESEKYFKLTDKGNMDLEDDIYAKREGEIYSKRTLANTEIDLIKFSNMIDNGKFKAAIDSLSDLLERVKTDRLKSEVYLYLSDAAYWLEKYNESLNYAVLSKALNGFDEKWIKPYACYYAARASVKLGNYSEAKKFINEAESYSDFDYQKKLKNLLSALSVEDK